MRALQSDLTTVCYFPTRWLSLRANSASQGRNGRARKQLKLGVSSGYKLERHFASLCDNSSLVCPYSESGGGGHGGHGGDGGGGSTPGTDLDDESGSPPGRRYSLLGITITLVSSDGYSSRHH